MTKFQKYCPNPLIILYHQEESVLLKKMMTPAVSSGSLEIVIEDVGDCGGKAADQVLLFSRYSGALLLGISGKAYRGGEPHAVEA